MKTCSECKVVKEPAQYHTYRSRSGELKRKAKCKSCQALYQKQYFYKECPIKLRYRKIFARYNITSDQYDALYEQQQRSCLVCLTPAETSTSLCVDHNHKTKEVRGLLCRSCNSALGLLKDDPTVLARASAYLLEKGDYSQL